MAGVRRERREWILQRDSWAMGKGEMGESEQV